MSAALPCPDTRITVGPPLPRHWRKSLRPPPISTRRAKSPPAAAWGTVAPAAAAVGGEPVGAAAVVASPALTSAAPTTALATRRFLRRWINVATSALPTARKPGSKGFAGKGATLYRARGPRRPDRTDVSNDRRGGGPTRLNDPARALPACRKFGRSEGAFQRPLARDREKPRWLRDRRPQRPGGVSNDPPLTRQACPDARRGNRGGLSPGAWAWLTPGSNTGLRPGCSQGLARRLLAR